MNFNFFNFLLGFPHTSVLNVFKDPSINWTNLATTRLFPKVQFGVTVWNITKDSGH